ncbi:MAG: very short patch repair endonuclease [Muribaculaceae bacterium]|nr:very short patch repair endonuclease [Muribaculaceae bacterium]
MTDIMTPEQRSRCMRAIKGKDTKPEKIVRKYLFSRGLRYRVNNRKLPGSPDLVFKKYKTVVFIDGCFWHGHEGCKYFKMPKSNTLFWKHKIAMNVARDYANNIDLKLAGWRVIRIWECDIRTVSAREKTLEWLYDTITRVSEPKKSIVAGYGVETDNEIPIAAEETPQYGQHE